MVDQFACVIITIPICNTLSHTKKKNKVPANSKASSGSSFPYKRAVHLFTGNTLSLPGIVLAVSMQHVTMRLESYYVPQ